jgi:hypothetical protein
MHISEIMTENNFEVQFSEYRMKFSDLTDYHAEYHLAYTHTPASATHGSQHELRSS